MLAMYKLYVAVHRRTDFYRIARGLYELMYPEYYNEKKQQVHNAIMRLAIATNIIHGIGHSW